MTRSRRKMQFSISIVLLVVVLLCNYLQDVAAFVQQTSISTRKFNHDLHLLKFTRGVSSAVQPRTSVFSRTTLFMASEVSDDNPYYKGMDAYQILGISRNADKSSIKSAYKKLVATWHPDRFPGDEVKQKEGTLRMEKINRAWYCLGDDDRKRRYDTYGEKGVGSSAASEEQLRNGGGPGFGSGFGDMGGSVDIGDLGDIFESFFGGGGARGGVRGAAGGARGGRRSDPNAPTRGEDIEVEVEIPFMTSIFGGAQTVRLRRLEECKPCDGSGVKPGAKIKTCQTCKGAGQVTTIQRTPFGAFQSQQICATCRGQGQEYEEYCSVCRGKGSTAETAEVTLNVPAGVESGAIMRVSGAGNAGRRKGPRGDLLAQVSVKADPRFERRNLDIYSEESISYTDAILGATLDAQTVDGKMQVKIPAGVQPGQLLRIRGSGVPRLNNPSVRGDAYISVKIQIPRNVSDEEKRLVEQIAALHGKK